MTTLRPFRLIALAVATAILAGGAWSTSAALIKLSMGKNQVSTAQARVEAAQQQLPQAIKREQFGEASKHIQIQAAQSGFDPALWAHRRIQRTAINLSRKDAQEQIAQLGAAGSGRLISADAFELSVLSREAGIFTRPTPDDRGLLLAINGTLYFPLTSKQR